MKRVIHTPLLTGFVSGPRVYHTWSLVIDGLVVKTGAEASEQLASLTMRHHAAAYARQHKVKQGPLIWGRRNQRNG